MTTPTTQREADERAMNDLKVHLMHAEVSAALERLSKLFKPGMRISFIARLPGNGEADVLIGDDHDADELIALVRRRFGSSTVSAPEEVRDAALVEGLEMAARYLDKQRQAVDQDHAYQEPDTGAWVFDRPETEEYSNTLAELADEIRALKRTTSGKGEAA